MNRGYFVYDKDEPWGIPVVAASTREAKRLGFAASEVECDWIDLRCRWQRHANVEGLPVGIVHDYMDALRRDITHWMEDETCDICGAEYSYVESLDGMAVCEGCVDRVYYIHDRDAENAKGTSELQYRGIEDAHGDL